MTPAAMKQVESFSDDAAARLPSDRRDPSPGSEEQPPAPVDLHVDLLNVSLAVKRTLVSSSSRTPAAVFVLAPSFLEG